MKEFDALYRRHKEARRYESFLAGQICALLANAYKSAKTNHYFTPFDFMPGEKAPPPKKQTPEEQHALLSYIAAAYGVKEERRKQ